MSHILTVFQEKILLLRNLCSYSVHSGTNDFYSQYKASYKVYPQKSNFVAGFTFHKAEQYYTQRSQLTVFWRVLVGKPQENVAEVCRSDVYKDCEIPWQKDWQIHILRGEPRISGCMDTDVERTDGAQLTEDMNGTKKGGRVGKNMGRLKRRMQRITFSRSKNWNSWSTANWSLLPYLLLIIMACCSCTVF